jgi:hypothetical protein
MMPDHSFNLNNQNSGSVWHARVTSDRHCFTQLVRPFDSAIWTRHAPEAHVASICSGCALQGSRHFLSEWRFRVFEFEANPRPQTSDIGMFIDLISKTPETTMRG